MDRQVRINKDIRQYLKAIENEGASDFTDVILQMKQLKDQDDHNAKILKQEE